MSVGLYQVNFYGANTDIHDGNNKTVQYPLKTAVLALSGLVTTKLYDLMGYYGTQDVETENKKYWNGSELIIVKSKDLWNVKIVPEAFPETEISINSFMSKDFLNCKYKWIDLSTYPIRPTELIGVYNKLIAVNLVAFGCDDNGSGFKEISFTFKERK